MNEWEFLKEQFKLAKDTTEKEHCTGSKTNPRGMERQLLKINEQEGVIVMNIKLKDRTIIAD